MDFEEEEQRILAFETICYRRALQISGIRSYKYGGEEPSGSKKRNLVHFIM